MILFLVNIKFLHLHPAIVIPAHLRNVTDTTSNLKRKKSAQPDQDQDHLRGQDLRKDVNINVYLPPDQGQDQDLISLGLGLYQGHLETAMASGKRGNTKRTKIRGRNVPINLEKYLNLHPTKPFSKILTSKTKMNCDMLKTGILTN